MISPNIEPDCMNARLYYHDYLDQVKRNDIPDNAFEHITRCRYCQDEISILENMLLEAEGNVEQSWRNSAVTTILRLHFAFIGKSIKCSTVKPFLPSLAIPGLEINISTPITTHLHSCQTCSEDLSILKDLVLNRRQLFRLGRFLLEKTTDDMVDCSKARFAIPSFVSMNLNEIDTDTLRHLCLCPDCRRLLYQHRESVYNELACYEPPTDNFPCESVSAADVFSYCLPYDIDPANDEYAEFRESLTSHLRSCPKCIAKIHQLHTIICNIAERPDSNVVTSFTLDEPVDEVIKSIPEKVSEGLSDNERIVEEQPVYSSSGITSVVSWGKLRKKASNLHLQRYIKPAFGIAAVLMVGFALFFSTTSAKAVSLEDIYRAVDKARNVCISRFYVGEEEPYSKSWLSNSLNVRIKKNKEQAVILDLNNWTRKELDIGSNSIIETIIQVDLRKDIENSLSNSFGLVPFSKISDIPEDAQWKQVNNLRIIPGTEVYDLTWSMKLDIGTTAYRMWRVFIDAATNLPIRIEWYRKAASDKEYIFETLNVVTYPSNDEIKNLIQDTFFNGHPLD